MEYPIQSVYMRCSDSDYNVKEILSVSLMNFSFVSSILSLHLFHGFLNKSTYYVFDA